MRIAFTFRNIDSSDAIKAYASEKLAKLQKYMRAPLDAEVTLSKGDLVIFSSRLLFCPMTRGMKGITGCGSILVAMQWSNPSAPTVPLIPENSSNEPGAYARCCRANARAASLVVGGRLTVHSIKSGPIASNSVPYRSFQ